MSNIQSYDHSSMRSSAYRVVLFISLYSGDKWGGRGRANKTRTQDLTKSCFSLNARLSLSMYTHITAHWSDYLPSMYNEPTGLDLKYLKFLPNIKKQKKGSKFSTNGSPMQKLVDTRLANLTLGLHLNKNFHRLCHKFRKVPHQKSYHTSIGMHIHIMNLFLASAQFWPKYKE